MPAAGAERRTTAQRAPSPEGRPVRGATKGSAAPAKAEAATASAASSSVAPAKRASGRTGTRVNIAVSDDGIQDLGPRPARAAVATATPATAGAGAGAGDPQRAADDVTRLIREKLKSLRTL
jgi:hypothetical protein